MHINSQQYQRARAGWFSINCDPVPGEAVILHISLSAGERIVNVGVVEEVKRIGYKNSLVRTSELKRIPGLIDA